MAKIDTSALLARTDIDDATKADLLDQAHVMREIDDASYFRAIAAVRPTVAKPASPRESDEAWLARQPEKMQRLVARRIAEGKVGYLATLRANEEAR